MTDEGDTTEKAPVPTEDDTLLGDDGFDLQVWEARLSAGKYDGFIVTMAAMLHDRGISMNVRRWQCEFRGETYTEEDVDGEVAEFAEKFASQGWGFLSALLGDNIRATIKPARAILYGICRAELKMTDKDARRAIKMPAKDIMASFSWYEVPSPGKDEEPA